MARDIEGSDRLQLMLLTVAADDYIAPASFIRAIDSFVVSPDALVGLAWPGHFRGAAGFWNGIKYTGVLKSGFPVHSKVKKFKISQIPDKSWSRFVVIGSKYSWFSHGDVKICIRVIQLNH